MRIACGGLVALLVSCTTANTNKACSAGSCSDPAFPYCDVEGTISGEPGTCIAVSCTPGEVRACLGEDALTCNVTGDRYEHVPCELGCADTPKAHCKYIEPRYMPEVCDTAATDDSFVVSNSAMLDPNLDLSCNGGIVPQQGAPAICVLRYRKIVVTPEGTLKVSGKSETGNVESVGRSIAFIADEEITIEGALDVSADGFTNGPGGGLIMSGGKAEIVSPGAHKAGGGAGGKTAGAAGGAVEDGGGGSGGLPTADPSLLAVFTGGAAGGRATTGEVTVASSGGGGGAAMLVSCAGAITITGTIDAGGGGGSGGLSLFGGAVPAFGGGAGGYIVLQAKSIAVRGFVFANGGGGGTGTQADLTAGANGSDGLRSATDAAPGHPGINGGGRGGTGGVGTKLPTAGGKATMTGGSAGGGGASVGFLQTYTPEGIEATLTPVAVSPLFQPNIPSKTR
jgi:hypothetical protein